MKPGGLISNLRRVVQAILGNVAAWLAPGWYVRFTGQTGRGADESSLEDVADYFLQCYSDYLVHLARAVGAGPDYFHGKRLLEYGPGDLPGAAMVMMANGAKQTICVDRFPLVQLTAKNGQIARILLDRLPQVERDRVLECFIERGHLESGCRPDKIQYLVKPSGLSGLQNAVDVVFSRAVLEHVNDLPATFRDMYEALKPGGIAIHQVDLKSHGLHRDNPLDFLCWPNWLWSLMYSAKGVPNRLRINAYRDAIRAAGLEIRLLEPGRLATEKDIQAVRPQLADSFKELPDADLSWLEFWLVCQKPVTA